MADRDPHKAWDAFWAREKQSGRSGGCLPSAYQAIEDAQIEAWSHFAASLPKSARVLDLATGDGRVMRWLLAARRDLKPVGADMARQLPDPPRGTRFHTGVAMENLPFPDNHFHALTSQFGFEYGDIARVALEAHRVLRDDGVLAILTHRHDGPILAHNLARREQIGWAIDQQQLPTLAKNSLRLRQAGMAIVPPAIEQAPNEGARLYGPQSAAWEIAEAIRRTLIMGARDHPANVAATIDTIAALAQNEIGRIASLEAACNTTADAKGFAAALDHAGFDLLSEEGLCEPGKSQHFADFRTYSRRDG